MMYKSILIAILTVIFSGTVFANANYRLSSQLTLAIINNTGQPLIYSKADYNQWETFRISKRNIAPNCKPPKIWRS